MKTAYIVTIVIAISIAALIAIGSIAVNSRRKTTFRETPKKKRILTNREEAMYNRLCKALPDAVIFAQVSFGALITAKSRAVRNTFDRKIADFVICNKSMQVLSIIELDDSSHQHKENQDKARDALLEKCGYRIIRYKNIPDIDQVKNDFT
ncbi:DUF2726 domain-containing protein [Verminephrobacter aporrectodeae subsp. tuberculatae]|nr:DUF2726 domain-containing protein [Verminephrobacter aporrectodeae]MCW5222834.1 DUF2726 domain-containing protein [Verminephrobacter aporrectodeae subsp. tuberculatae]MCW5288298.1 DUF2726 domain-containing protein [Verminephrobacter aporrectodeae subsp. tuberculatae]